MGFFDSISDLLDAALPWSTAEAEAPKEEEAKVGASFLCLLGSQRGVMDGGRPIGE